MAAKNGRKTILIWQKVPDDSTDTPEVKNSVEISLSCTISKINAFYAEIKKFAHSYYIHMPNFKRIRPMVAEP